VICTVVTAGAHAVKAEVVMGRGTVVEVNVIIGPITAPGVNVAAKASRCLILGWKGIDRSYAAWVQVVK
jgi:hypothetical protein